MAAAGLAQAAWAQSGADGAIGGRVLTASGAPVAGAVIAVREAETGLEQSARSGSHGEFLVPRLPVGEYTVRVESRGAELALPEPVRVRLGEVTEIEAHGRGTNGRGRCAHGREQQRSRDVAGSELAVLPVDGGAWRSAALTMAGANGAAEKDDDASVASFRGVDLAQNSTRRWTEQAGMRASAAGRRVRAWWRTRTRGRMRCTTRRRGWAAGRGR